MKTFNNIRKILIAVEDSQYAEKAAAYGYELARKLEAEIGLLHVDDIPATAPYTADPMLNEPPILMPEIMNVQEQASKKLLDRIAETYSSDTNVYTFHKIGNPKDEILQLAEEWDADLIVLGTHGRTGFDHFLAGSVAEKVVRKAKCPVLIIPNKEDA